MLITWKDYANSSSWRVSGKTELIHGICSQHLLLWPAMAGSQGKRARGKLLPSFILWLGEEPVSIGWAGEQVWCPLHLKCPGAQRVSQEKNWLLNWFYILHKCLFNYQESHRILYLVNIVSRNPDQEGLSLLNWGTFPESHRKL